MEYSKDEKALIRQQLRRAVREAKEAAERRDRKIGMDWELSDEAKERLAEIDKFIVR